MTKGLFIPVMAAALCLNAGLSAQNFTASIANLSAQPAAIPTGTGTVVLLTASVFDDTVLPSSILVQRLDTAGNVTGTLGGMHDDGLNGDAVAGDGNFTARLTIYESVPGLLRLRVSGGIQGSARRTLSEILELPISGIATSIQILSPARDSYLSLSPVQVQGTISDPSVVVTVNGVTATKSGTSFSASVPLIEGTNTLTAVTTTAAGTVGTSSVQVFLDTTPPRVTVTSPIDAFHTTGSSIDVTGIVNDIVVGTVNAQQATVTVNGIAAAVQNRTFNLSNVALNLGSNAIRVEGRDRAGNSNVQMITVVRDAVPANTATLTALSGDGQTGRIGTALGTPLVVQLKNAQGLPAVNVPVTFRVVESNGLVNSLPAVVVNSDGQGKSQVMYSLGNRAGAGSNRVEAFASTFQGTAVFTATAQNGTAAKIVQDSGLNQTGPTGQALPFPFVAVITDTGNNRLAGVPVTFNVRTGGGTLNGLTQVTAVSDSDGRIQTTLTLGLEEGHSNNSVEANFTGNPGQSAVFYATALTPGMAVNTTISGVVRDNSNQPIPGATIRLFQVAQAAQNVQQMQIAPSVTTDAQGNFKIFNAPVGIMKLMADGSTALPAGAWPTLEYDLLTISGRDNSVGSPIYLPKLDQVNRLCVTATTGGTLTLPDAPGFSLTVAPGSAMFPGGSRSGCISVSPVNPDKVPMAPGFGQQPRFIVTIQPVGTMFNPPARIQIPNVDGLAPREKTEMYSYDHDLASFVAIGTGTVSQDGSVILADPGVGVLKAGWHCGGNPSPTGSAGTCPTCNTCQNGSCAPAPGSCDDHDVCTKNDTCKNGVCTGEPIDVSSWHDKTGAQVDTKVQIPPDIISKINGVFNYIPGLSGVKFKEVRVGVSAREKNCCDKVNGPQENGLFEGTGTFQLTAEVANIPIFGTPVVNKEFDFGLAVVSVDFQFGVALGVNLRLNVSAGYRTNKCTNEDCLFGEVNASLDPDIKATVKANACLETLFTSKTCAGLTITPASLRANFQFGVSYNKPNCKSGLAGVVRLGSIQFRAEFALNTVGSQRVVFTYDLLAAPVTL